MAKSRVLLITITGVVLLVIVFGGYFIWTIFCSHKYDPGSTATNVDVANYTSVPPPPEAQKIRVASFEHGQGRLVFVRFSAPPDICRKYAAMVKPGAALKPLNQDQLYNDLMAMYSGANQLQDLRWFDLPYARDYWTMQSEKLIFRRPLIEKISDSPDVVGADVNTTQQGYLMTSLRIDISRGVFYFLQQN